MGGGLNGNWNGEDRSVFATWWPPPHPGEMPQDPDSPTIRWSSDCQFPLHPPGMGCFVEAWHSGEGQRAKIISRHPFSVLPLSGSHADRQAPFERLRPSFRTVSEGFPVLLRILFEGRNWIRR